MKTIALTGPHGVVGRHVHARLTQAGFHVMPVGRDRWDLRHFKSIEQLDVLLADAQALLHLGATVPIPNRAQDREEICDINIRACAAIGTWAAARGIPIVYAGSAGVYARHLDAPAEDAPLESSPYGGFYGLSKMLGELILTGLQAEGLPLCVLRISSVYGTGMHPEKLVAKMLALASAGGTIRLRAPVEDCVNLVHAWDVANAVLASLQGSAQGVFNIAGPGLVSMIDLAECCIAVAGNGRIEIDPDLSGRSPMRHFDVSCCKAAEQLNYRPQITLRDGLQLMRECRYAP